MWRSMSLSVLQGVLHPLQCNLVKHSNVWNRQLYSYLVIVGILIRFFVTIVECQVLEEDNNLNITNTSGPNLPPMSPYRVLLWGDHSDHGQVSEDKLRLYESSPSKQEGFGNVRDFTPSGGNDGDEWNDENKEGMDIFPGNIDHDLDERTYPGEFGFGVLLEETTLQEETEINEGYDKHGFNLYVSDMIPENRSLLDYRSSRCQQELYSEDMPTASVIITFYNEPSSTLMRTLHSILDRSRERYLREIVVINDFSTLPNDINVEQLGAGSVEIKVINCFKREGVARARTLGAVNAKGETLIFLDSHVEVTEGWLEPLLHRISKDKTSVIVPTVDVIDANTFQYKASNGSSQRVGVFDWNLQVKWIRARDSILKSLSSPTEPVPSAIIPFGMFAIDKKFLQELGYFDTKFSKWGGESLEMSFKTWMCGGKIEISPCSHIGHLFKGEQPLEHLESRKENLARIAASWMGSHSKYFYEMANIPAGYKGNVSSRLEIGEKLSCKSFSWYLDHVATEVFNPALAVGEGEVINMAFGWYLCLDSSSSPDTVGKEARVWPCHDYGGNQHWHYSTLGELRRIDLCLDYSSSSKLIMYYCHRKSESQKWRYDFQSQLMHHPSTSKCLSMTMRSDLYLEDCDSDVVLQKWNFKVFHPDRLVTLLETVFNHTELIN